MQAFAADLGVGRHIRPRRLHRPGSHHFSGPIGPSALRCSVQKPHISIMMLVLIMVVIAAVGERDDALPVAMLTPSSFPSPQCWNHLVAAAEEWVLGLGRVVVRKFRICPPYPASNPDYTTETCTEEK